MLRNVLRTLGFALPQSLLLAAKKPEQGLNGHPVAAIVLMLSLAACRQTPDTGAAQQSVSPPATAAVATPDSDVTKVGVLANANFRGDKAIILGLSLGQTWDEARTVVQANPELTIREGTSRRFHVYDRGGPTEGDRAVFLCQWAEGTAGMGRLVIYPRIARFLPAGDARLFVARSVATLPPDVKSWLGPEDRAVVSLNVRSAKITDHVYEKRALEVSDTSVVFHAPEVQVSFVRPGLHARHK